MFIEPAEGSEEAPGCLVACEDDAADDDEEDLLRRAIALSLEGTQEDTAYDKELQKMEMKKSI